MKGEKFKALKEYLERCGQDEVRLTFLTIEREILHFELSRSYRENRENWANTRTLSLPHCWLDAGYYTHDVDMRNGVVHFTKGVTPVVRESGGHRRFTGDSGHVIILNKAFLGGWLGLSEGNIGHEVIDFLTDDNNQQYVYNNPWGSCRDDIWVEGTTRLERRTKEKYLAKYLVLTSGTRNKDFDILYVVELGEKLHRFHATKNDDEDNENNIKVPCPQEAIDLIDELDIKYNGRPLYEIFDYESLCVTFKGARLYKAEEPISVTGLIYNFQRNKGYLWDDKNETDYQNVLALIEDSIASGALTQINPRNVNHEEIGDLNANKTFLDLISMQSSEQVYTNMLHSVLEQGELFKHFCHEFKEDKPFDENGDFKVFRETKVVNGRMDVCGESDNQRVIIENKVYSGLNGLKPEDNETQLSTYHIWGAAKEMEPLCFVVAPNFRIGEIRREIAALDPAMESIYLVKSYGDIASFLEREYQEGHIPEDYIYYSLVPQIINAFRNYSYSTKEDLYARMFLDATN